MTSLKTISEVKKQNLLIAIDRATGQGVCEYSTEVTKDDGTKAIEPSCVIGQLAVLEGLSLDDLDQWHGAADRLVINEYPHADILDPYPMELLKRLQSLWDSYTSLDPSVIKADMKAIVEFWNDNRR